MRFVVAPDSFKGSLSAQQAGEVIERALISEMPEATVEVIPVADGGEGTVESFLLATGGEQVQLEVTGPTGEKIPSFYGILGDRETVVIETAAVAGLTLVPDEKRDPLRLTTYGIGESIIHALDRGFRKLIIGIGGSATNDGGLGMLQALGVTLQDADGSAVAPYAASLADIHAVDYSTIDPRVYEAEIRVANDVDNPLCGPKGASYIFGPQKGATPEQVEVLDRSLATFANRVESHLEKTFQETPGAGAAGGLGFAFLTIGAELKSGAALVAHVAELEQRFKKADWLITGEGKTDSQTMHGKLPFYLARLAKKHRVSTLLISGSLEGDLEPLYDVFDSIHAISNGPMALEDAMKQAEHLLYHKARNLARLFKLFKYSSQVTK